MTNGIVCCVCSISATSVLQFVLKRWQNITTRFRRRTSHSKIATNDEPYCKGAIECIILDFSKPGEEKLWKSKPLECGSWGGGANGAQSGMITKLGLLKNGKNDTSMCERSGQPVVTSWRETRARWNSAIHCERGNTSWQNGATRCHPSKRSKATAIYHWKRWKNWNWQWNQDHS